MDDKSKARIEQEHIELFGQLESMVGKKTAALFSTVSITELTRLVAGEGLAKTIEEREALKRTTEALRLDVDQECTDKIKLSVELRKPEVYTHANDIGRVIVSIVKVMQSKRKMHEEDLPTITAAVRQAFNAGRRRGKRETTKGD